MNMNRCLLTATVMLVLLTTLADDGKPPVMANWQPHTYPRIGLKLQLPQWKADIEEDAKMWSLMAYPLVENPAADVQYRVLISAFKYTKDQYLRLIRNPTMKSTDWSLSEHLQTCQMTNAFWIYSRRDIWCSNGFSYTLTGRIKRIGNSKPEALEKFGGNEVGLAAQLQRVLDSVEPLAINATNAP